MRITPINTPASGSVVAVPIPARPVRVAGTFEGMVLGSRPVRENFSLRAVYRVTGGLDDAIAAAQQLAKQPSFVFTPNAAIGISQDGTGAFTIDSLRIETDFPAPAHIDADDPEAVRRLGVQRFERTDPLLRAIVGGRHVLTFDHSNSVTVDHTTASNRGQSDVPAASK